MSSNPGGPDDNPFKGTPFEQIFQALGGGAGGAGGAGMPRSASRAPIRLVSGSEAVGWVSQAPWPTTSSTDSCLRSHSRWSPCRFGT